MLRQSLNRQGLKGEKTASTFPIYRFLNKESGQKALCFNNVYVLFHVTDKLEGNHMQYQLVLIFFFWYVHMCMSAYANRTVVVRGQLVGELVLSFCKEGSEH